MNRLCQRASLKSFCPLPAEIVREIVQEHLKEINAVGCDFPTSSFASLFAFLNKSFTLVGLAAWWVDWWFAFQPPLTGNPIGQASLEAARQIAGKSAEAANEHDNRQSNP